MFDHESVDPRSKLALATAVSLVAIATTDVIALLALLGVTLAVVVLGRGFGTRRWIEALRPLSVLVPILLIVNTLFYVGGRSVLATTVAGYRVGVTTGGIEMASIIALRLLAIAGVAAWFAATTSAERFEAGLVRLGVPWSLAFLLSLSVRLVPEMRRRFALIEEAQRSRGLTIDGGPIATARARVPMVLPFLSAIIRHGYALGDALVARGFDRGGPRTSTIRIRHGPGSLFVDGVAVAVVVAVIVV